MYTKLSDNFEASASELLDCCYRHGDCVEVSMGITRLEMLPTEACRLFPSPNMNEHDQH